MAQHCEHSDKLFQQIFARENPLQLFATEKSHLASCPVCQDRYKKLQSFEARMKEHVRQSLAAIEPAAVKLPPEVEKTDKFNITILFSRCFARKPLHVAMGLLITFLFVGIVINAWFSGLRPTHFSCHVTAGELLAGNAQRFGIGTVLDLSGERLFSSDMAQLTCDNYSFSIKQTVFRLAPHQVHIEQGSARFIVKQPGSLAVTTPVVKINITGTEFTVIVQKNGKTRVEVISGKVKITTLAEESIKLLSAHEQAEFSPKKAAVNPGGEAPKVQAPSKPVKLNPDNNMIDSNFRMPVDRGVQPEESQHAEKNEELEESQEDWSEVTLDDMVK